MQAFKGVYFEQMLRPNRQIVRVVLIGLMLVIGSVQADVSYYCGMMDTVMHDDCCSMDGDADQMMVDDGKPCCEKSVDLVIETAANLAQTTPNPIKFESDVDPPDASVSIFPVASIPPDKLSVLVLRIESSVQPHGSAIYLTTQRLRI